jgi:malonyl-CoA O-methyltransferase
VGLGNQSVSRPRADEPARRPRALTARDGYRLWAPTYSEETAISHLESGLAAALTPPVRGLRLLDAGCGTGRRLAGCGAALALGVDLCPEMLSAGPRDPDVRMVVGDVRALPLPDRAFDVVWCRLVMGHLPDCRPAYRELARVADAGGVVVVTDFHPAAWAAGHRRTFRSEDEVHELEHHVHEADAQIEAAKACGLGLLEARSAEIGTDARPFYERAGRLALFEEHAGLPVVLALAFRREA